MNDSSILVLVSTVICLGVGWFVFAQNRRRLLSKHSIFGIPLADKNSSYHEKVKLASELMTQETELNKMAETILELIDSQIHPVFCQLYFSNSSGKQMELLISNQDKQTKVTPDLFLWQAPFIEWFSHSKQSILRKELESQRGTSTPESALLKTLHETMNSTGVEVCIPAFHHDHLMGVILLGEKHSGVYSEKDISFLKTLSNDAAAALRHAQLIAQLQQLLSSIIDAFATAIGKMDPDYTYEHIVRTKGIARRIVQKLKERRMPLGMTEELFLAGILLHDIGKLFTPREILYKKGPLNEEEWKIMRKHPMDGAEVLEQIQGLEGPAQIIRYHQERWDGKGYPEGLKENDIPIGAQVAAVADAFDAMTSDRPYRKGMSRTQAIEELKRNAATQFSPSIVKIMIELYEEGSV